MQAQSVTLDFLKPVGTVVDLSDKFNARVGDSMTPFNLFVTEGGKPKALNGLHPELEAAVGDGELKDGKVVMSDNAKGIHWVGSAKNVTGYNRLTLTFPAEVFPQSGFCYGHLILANDAGVRESSVDIWFKVLDGLEIMGLAADYYDSAIELELKKLKEANSQAAQRLSEMKARPQAFANIDDLKAKYPVGNSNLNVTVDDGHLWIWLNGGWRDCGQFQTAGIDQALVDQIKEALAFANGDNFIANGSFTTGKTDPAITINDDTKLAVTNYLGRKWLQITGVGNSSMRGAQWVIDSADKIAAIQNYPLQLSFDIQSSVSQTFNIDIHFIDNNNQDMNKSINIDQLTLNAWQLFNYKKTVDLNISSLAGVAKVVIMIYSNNTGDLGTILITGLKASVKYADNELPGANLLPPKPLTVNNNSQITDIAYLGEVWHKLTTTIAGNGQGYQWIIDDADKVSLLFNYPLQLSFNLDSLTVNQLFNIDVHFYNKNGSDLGNSYTIDSIQANAGDLIHYDEQVTFDSNHLQNATKISLMLYSTNAEDVGAVLLNNESALLKFKTNQLKGPSLIDGQPFPNNGETVISTTKYLEQEWLQMTSTANTQFRGLQWQIDNKDKIYLMATYPVKFQFNIQSSIAQTFNLDLHFYDKNGNDLGNSINIDKISLNAWELLNYQKEFSVDYNHVKDATKVVLMLYTPGTADLGTVLINDYSAVLEYNTNQLEGPGLINSQPIVTNDGTVLSTIKYLGENWFELTSAKSGTGQGVQWIINDPVKVSLLPYYPLHFSFDLNSLTVSQLFNLDVHFYDKDGKDLQNSYTIDSFQADAGSLIHYEKEIAFDFSHLQNVQKVSLVLYTTNTEDMGEVLLNHASALFKYKTNKPKGPELIDGEPFPNNDETVISTTKYLEQEWLQMTSTANTQFRGLQWQIDNKDKILLMATYPVKFQFNIQSSIAQTFNLDLHFYDKNGNDLGNSINIDKISLNAWELFNYQKRYLVDYNHINNAAKVVLMLYTPGTEDLGTVLINDYSAVLEYNTNENTIKPSSSDYKGLPEVYLNGSTSSMSGTNYVTMQFTFKDNGREIDGFASTKWQGDSSLAYDKKAYRIKTFEDRTLSKKMKFKPCPLWDADNKFNLKAYYTDPLLCRDVVNANIGTDIWSTQKNMPDDLVETDDFGFVDGFPVKVFINNEFAGIYSFNTAKGDYGKQAKAVISGETYTAPTAFSALPDGGVKLDGSDFEMISPDEPSDEIKKATNDLITFVSTSSDDDFKAQLSQHIDLESLIDYFIFLNVIENGDAAGKNQTLITWDLKKWYFHPYDLDTTYGVDSNGKISEPSTGLLGLNSHLFTRLNELFIDQIKTRYKELRTWLTPVHVLKMYRDHINLIGEANYEDEFKLWDNPNHDKNTYNFLKTHIYKRFKLLDSLWLK